jgi:hypothetical protein
MGTIVTAVIAGLVGGVLAHRLSRQSLRSKIALWNEMEASRSADFTIILDRNASNQCFSSTTSSGRARRGQQIFWNIHDMRECLGSGDQVEIRFKNEAQDDPLHERRPRHHRRIKAKVKDQAEARRYAYDVWLISAAGGERRLEDPELEIVP